MALTQQQLNKLQIGEAQAEILAAGLPLLTITYGGTAAPPEAVLEGGATPEQQSQADAVIAGYTWPAPPRYATVPVLRSRIEAHLGGLTASQWRDRVTRILARLVAPRIAQALEAGIELDLPIDTSP